MANKKSVGYDVRVNYGQSASNTKKVTSAINDLTKAIAKLKSSSEIRIKFEGLNKALDQTTAKVKGVSGAMNEMKSTAKSIGGSMSDLSAKIKSVQTTSNGLAKELKTTAAAMKEIERSNRQQHQVTKQNTTSSQISSLKKDADILHQAYRKGTVTVTEYDQQMGGIRSKLQGLYQAQREINHITAEQVGLSKKLNLEMDSIYRRAGYLATRWAVLWAGDKLMEGVSSISRVEKEMAGFAQVMKHGTGQTNAFAKSLLEVDPSNMKNALQLGDEEAEHFKHQLEDMQVKLQDLGVKYGTTSHEMIESAKLWGRAYKDNNTVLALTDAATKLAVADAFDIVSANKALESSIMQWGFQIGNANDAMSVSNRIIDSWTALAHNYTVSAQTLSEANKRMAQSAKEVGVSFHSAQAFISVMARKTQAEGGEIGNALKSIFGSIHSNKGIQALQDFGVEVYKIGEDGTKSFRKVDDVLLDLMIKADRSKESLEGLLKAISGGKWQWNKANAMLDLTEYLEALKQSTSSYGFTDAQVGMQLDTIEAKMKQVAMQWEKMISNSHSLGKAMKTGLDGALVLMQWLDKIPRSLFVIIGGYMSLMIAKRRFGGVARTVLNNVSRSWDKATRHVQKYVKQAQEASKATSKMGRSLATARGAVNGLASGFTKLAGGKAGVATILLTVAAAATELALAYRFSTQAIEESFELHQRNLQQQQEQYARLEESKDIVAQYTNIYNKLTDALKGLEKGSAEYNKVLEQRHQAEEGLNNILGESVAQQVLLGETTEEQNRIADEAIKKKQATIEQSMKTEREAIAQARKDLQEATQANLDSLDHESKGWFDRIAVIYQFSNALDIARIAFANLVKLLSQHTVFVNEKLGAPVRLVNDINKFVSDGLRENGLGLIADAVDFQGAAVARVTNELDYIKNTAEEWDSWADEQINDTMKTVRNRVQLDGLQKMQDLDRMQSAGHVTDSIGGGNTGDYTRSEVDPDGGTDGKGSKGSKEKNPLYGTKEGQAIDFLMKQGLTANQAYGIVGNLIQESGLSPTIENATGHKGIAQWDGSRWSNLESFAAANGSYAEDFETQLAFLVHELNTTERGGWQSVLERAVNRTPEEYAHYFDMFVERSGGEESAQRQAYARELANTGYAEEQGSVSDRASKILDKQKKIDEATEKLEERMAEMTEAMIPKEQQELTKGTKELNKKLKEVADEMNELKNLNPSADLTRYQETIRQYTEIMQRRIQDELTQKGFDKAMAHAVDNKAIEDILNDDLYENFWVKDQREAQALRMQADIAKAKYNAMEDAYMRGDSDYTPEDLRKAKIAWLELEKSAKKYAKALKDDVRQQTHDIFHSMLFEGQSIKDIWKNLWKQLAEDALKMLFKINDGKGGLFQNLLKMKDKNYLAGINATEGEEKNIGGLNEQLNQQYVTNRHLEDMNNGWKMWLEQTNNGTNFSTATFTDAVIYSNGEGVKDVDLPEGNKDGEKSDDVSKYINAGMKIAGGNQSGFGKVLGSIGTVASIARSLGLLRFAGGGYVNKDQLVRVGEGNKKEWIIPTHDKGRGRQLLGQAAKDLDIGFTSGIEPKWQHQSTANGALAEQTKRQDALMNRMVANSEAMTRGMNYMANNGSGTKESIAQPVFMKQTISDQDFLAKYNKLVNLGKLRQA